MGAKMMLWSSPQAPPRAVGASHKAIAVPPSTEILSFPPAKNATHCPSGEKKGAKAPSVPANSVALGSFRRRVNSREFDTNTSLAPSGDMNRANADQRAERHLRS